MKSVINMIKTPFKIKNLGFSLFLIAGTFHLAFMSAHIDAIIPYYHEYAGLVMFLTFLLSIIAIFAAFTIKKRSIGTFIGVSIVSLLLFASFISYILVSIDQYNTVVTVKEDLKQYSGAVLTAITLAFIFLSVFIGAYISYIVAYFLNIKSDDEWEDEPS